MVTLVLWIMGAAGALAQGGASENIVLHNQHLAVTFEGADAGPRLTAIKCSQTGKTHRFEDDQQLSLFVVPADVIHDPGLKVEFAVQKDFKFGGAEVGADQTRAVFHFSNALVEVDVGYQLDPKAPVLRKTIVCKAKAKPAYVAGVRQWMLKTVEASLAWPKKYGPLGQPAVFLAEPGGYLLTLEWPRAEVTSQDGAICVQYCPGYLLAPGQSKEVAAGSVLFFKRGFEKDPLDTARHAFFQHMRARVNPKTPCPIKFTTWGPWLAHARTDRILETLDDMAYVGTNLFHFDAGWQWPEHPYSQRLPKVLKADDQTWDREMTQPERVPGGLLPLVKAVKARGMALSLWFDATGCAFVREGEEWAVRDQKGELVKRRMWEGRWPEAFSQSLASEYGKRLKEFLRQAQTRYDLGGVMFDNNHFLPDYAADRDTLANGWGAEDVQLRTIMEIFDECEQRHPGMYRFLCHGASWPWALLHVTHIHAGDPGTSGDMAKAVAMDCPARAMAHERRLAWKRHHDNFVPSWGVKGDVAGWSLQQWSPIPINLAHTEELIPAGEGWTQNMFTCFATTSVRDIRFSFRQMPRFDREVLKEWLAWGQRRAEFVFNCRHLFDFPQDPNAGIVGFSHVGQGRGVIYLFNCSFEMAQAEVRLDEHAGFTPADAGIPAYIVYPMKAHAPGEKLSYGQVLKAPIGPKDCLVIEVGLETPEKPVPYADYEKTIATVKRSFDTQFMTPADRIIEAVQRGPVRLEVGDTKGDRRLAAQMLETLGSAIGRRISVDECLAVPLDKAQCRLIIGTHEGLSKHPDAGKLFQETLYERYLAWDGMLVSAPLAGQMPGAKQPTFCLIAPRPEQLARLAINLVAAVTEKAPGVGDDDAKPQWGEQSVSVAVPAGRPVLRFRPLMKPVGAGKRGDLDMPPDLDRIRYEIQVERDGNRTLLWREDIPPFVSFRGQSGWWGDRVVSVADLAGQKVKFHFTARPMDGRTEEPLTVGGVDRMAVLELEPAKAK